MITVLLEKIITILEGWIQSFSSHAQHVEDKLDSLDQTASDIKTNTEPISDIKDNTGAVITPIQNIKSNTDSIKQSSQTSANNTTAILNNVGTLSTNTGRAAAFAEDCANNTLDIKDKVTTIASDTTQLRADTSELNDMSDKIYEALKWSLADKYIDETESGASPMSFDTDIADDLKSLKIGIIGSQSGSGDPSPSNVRPISGFSNVNITVNGNNVTIALGQTIFKGVLDVISGILTITNYYHEIKSVLNKSESANGYFWYASISYLSIPSIFDLNSELITNRFINSDNTTAGSNEGVISFYANGIIRWKEQGSLSINDYNTYLDSNPIQIVYKLLAPIEVQLTASQIAAIKGVNTITSDTNGDIEVTYKESIKHYLDKQDN